MILCAKSHPKTTVTMECKVNDERFENSKWEQDTNIVQADAEIYVVHLNYNGSARHETKRRPEWCVNISQSRTTMATNVRTTAYGPDCENRVKRQHGRLPTQRGDEVWHRAWLHLKS